MSSKAGKGLVPALRFPEFRDGPEWQEKPLADLISTITPPKKIPTTNYLTEGLFPIVDQGQSDIAGWTNDPDALIKNDLPLIVFGDHTCALKLLNQPFSQGADGIKVIKGKQAVNTEYLYQFLRLRPVVTEEYKRHFSILKTKVVAYPEKISGEQQKIAACLSSLDDLIAAQAKKIEALKAHKKGLMQQLFPAEGETVPRFRFPEFGGEKTEISSLRSIVRFSSGGTPSKDEEDYWNGDIPWISASSMYDENISDSECKVTPLAIGSGTRIAPKGSLLILVRGSMLFNRVPMGIAVTDVAFNQDVKALSVCISVDANFLLFQLLALSKHIPINETGIGAGKIESNLLAELPIYLPSIIEQKKVAKCLSSLGVIITAKTKKLDTLKTLKQGLMQRLFPSTNEAEV